MKRLLASIGLFILLSLTLAFSAAAYLDPSSMLYVIQIFAGVFIASGAAVAIYWKRIKLFFKNRKKKREQAARMQNADNKDSANATNPN